MVRVPEPVAAVRRAVRDALAGPPLFRAKGTIGRLDGAKGTFSQNDAVAVACSGGADSLALAAATAYVGAEQGLAVHGIVVDHGLQDGSRAVAARTADVVTGLGLASVRVETVVVDGPGGPEAAAREARYAALRAARPPGAPVLLGHTLDDQAETVLLGLGRGSGARSLAGMTSWDDPWLRPLLGLRRATTRAACAAAGLEPWEDPHNTERRFVRVRLREEVLPLLEDVLAGGPEGGVARALARTADQLADDDAALSSIAADLRAATETGDGQLDAGALLPAPAAVRRRVLRGWLTDAGVRSLTDAHLRAVDALVGRWRGQGGPALAGGLEVVRRRGRLLVREAAGPGARSGRPTPPAEPAPPQ